MAELWSTSSITSIAANALVNLRICADSLEYLLLVDTISPETISALAHISSNLDCSDYFKGYYRTMAFVRSTNVISDPIN